MNSVKVLSFCLLGILSAAALPAQGRALKLGTATGSLGQTASVGLRMDSDSQVQGLVAAMDWNGAELQGTDLVSGAALAAADVVVARVEPAFAVLGVVMDNDGRDGEIIPPGANIDVATLKVKCLGPSGDTDVVTPVVFKDGTYSAAVGGPLLDNIIVVGGLSIGRTEGLVLTNGSVRCTPPPPGRYTIVSKSGFYGACVQVPVELGNDAPVQGFVTAIAHPAGITLNRILLGPAAAGADFQQDEKFANGGTFGVVMELDGNPPFRTIPTGTNNVIAIYEYCSQGPATVEDCSRPNATFDLTFVDNVLGDPLKENVIVVAGRSKNPELNNGSLTLSINTNVPPCRVEVPSEMSFAVGSCELVDDPNSDDKDVHIPGTIRVTRGTVARPSCFGVGLWYKSPEDDEPDEAKQMDHLQGVSMAVCYDANCIQCKETWSLTGTITEAVGAEFVNVHCENDMTDGDPGELVVGILVDALPPFDGEELPPTNDYLRLICVDFCVNPAASCDACRNTEIKFCNANGRGRVTIRNLASVMNQSVEPQLVDGSGHLTFLEEPSFIRGDCNNSDQGSIAVDISDAAAVISFLFLTGTWQYHPVCLDACDANDDGRVDLADSVYILRYLFKFDRDPKPPFPGAGPDPTGDKLSCGAGTDCPTTVP